MSQWHAPPSPQKTTTTKNQSTLPIKHTTRARTTQIIYAQVQKCTAHSAQQTLTQSFPHTNSSFRPTVSSKTLYTRINERS